jgi:peptidoglycan/LPS O-acetylase OafA/YrhL
MPLLEQLANIFELGDSKSSKRLLPMEGLRGFAVILVFMVHYTGAFKWWLREDSFSFALSESLAIIGLTGVDLFFVLSGYLIYGMLIHKPRNYRTFIRRRIQRIDPTFICVFLIYLLLSVVFPSENKIPSDPPAAFLYVLENVLLLPGIFNVPPIITVAWSLSYEFFFYLLMPFLATCLVLRYWKPASRVFFFSGLAVVYSAYCFVGPYPRLRLIMFISGILLYETISSYGLDKKITQRVEYAILLLLVLSLAFFYIASAKPNLLSFIPGSATRGQEYGFMLLFVTFFLLCLGCFGSHSLLRRMFAWTPIRWLGNMSYSYYLIHGVTLKGLSKIVLPMIPMSELSVVMFWVGIPVAFCVTLVSSSILFILIERRFSIGRPPVPRISRPAREANESVPGEFIKVRGSLVPPAADS